MIIRRTNNFGRILPTFVAVLAGAGAGLAVSLFVGSSSTQSPQSPASANLGPAPARAILSPAVRDDSDAPIARMRPQIDPGRLETLERRVAQLAAEKPSEPQAQRSEPGLSREERERATLEAFDVFTAKLDAHEQEPRDPTWAKDQERRITDGLAMAPAGGAPATSFSVEGVDCRSKTCTARLRWSDLGHAKNDLRSVFDPRRGVTCAQEIFLPPGSAPGAEVEASLYIECRDRSQG